MSRPPGVHHNELRSPSGCPGGAESSSTLLLGGGGGDARSSGRGCGLAGCGRARCFTQSKIWSEYRTLASGKPPRLTSGDIGLSPNQLFTTSEQHGRPAGRACLRRRESPARRKKWRPVSECAAFEEVAERAPGGRRGARRRGQVAELSLWLSRHSQRHMASSSRGHREGPGRVG